MFVLLMRFRFLGGLKMIKVNGNAPDLSTSENKTDNKTRLLLKLLMRDAGLSLTKTVKKMNEMHPELTTTTQNISNKLARDSINFSEFIALAEACGYSINFCKISNTPKIQESKKTANSNYNDLLLDGYADCESINFDLIIIAGANAEQAAKWIKENLDSELNETQEIMLMIAANRQFGVNCKPVAKGRNFQML